MRELGALGCAGGAGRVADDYLLGPAARCVGDFEAALRMNAIAVKRMRDQGRLALLAQTLVLRSVDSVLVGDFLMADAAAAEGPV